MTLAADKLELFFGDASDAAARVYALLPRDKSSASLQLTGELIGPECRFAQTLSARIPFRDCGPGESLLAEAVVPDPCFWTPGLPMMYRANLGARSEGRDFGRLSRARATAEQHVPLSPCGRGARGEGDRDFQLEKWMGIRRLGVRGRSLGLDNARWVARGLRLERIAPEDLPLARETGTAIISPPADDAIYFEASRFGVPLVIDLTDGPVDIGEVRRAGAWPAVFAFVFDLRAEIGADARAAARNVLFAAKPAADDKSPLAPGRWPGVPPAWAQVVLVDLPLGSSVSAAASELPILVHRRTLSAAENANIAAARAACDRLQYELAPHGDFAGYFV